MYTVFTLSATVWSISTNGSYQFLGHVLHSLVVVAMVCHQTNRLPPGHRADKTTVSVFSTSEQPGATEHDTVSGWLPGFDSRESMAYHRRLDVLEALHHQRLHLRRWAEGTPTPAEPKHRHRSRPHSPGFTARHRSSGQSLTPPRESRGKTRSQFA
jgi:hypothetical protein